MTDWGAFYKLHVDAVAGLAPNLTDEQLGTTVPATPEWTVHDVLRHMAGVPADAVDGRMDGAPGEEWTARHVQERADRTPAELVEELRSNEDAAAASLEGNPTPALAWDIAVHHADLHEALGMGRPAEEFWKPVAEAVGQRAPEQVRDVDPYELFRGTFSRRSRGQMQAWGTGADAEALDGMCIFGPRDDEQPIA